VGDGSETRKRGDVLLETIYAATTDVVAEDGYMALTFVKVAQRAHTSRTVLYRRWGTVLNLVHDTMTFKTSQAFGGTIPDQLRDTGSLRGDLLHLLGVYQRIYTVVGLDIVNAVLFEMSRNNQQAQELKAGIDAQNEISIQTILGFAQARGESVSPLSAVARGLPFDLVRVRYMLGHPLTDDTVQEIVDTVLLPVFQDPRT
jgi:AcrR family transcriptional regulator